MARIIQFYHPSLEPCSKQRFCSGESCFTDWNSEGFPHRRKFMLSEGSYVKNGNKPEKGKLLFWGEWEPPSKVEKLEKKTVMEYGVNPEFLHYPFLPNDEQLKKYQNSRSNNAADCKSYGCEGGYGSNGGNGTNSNYQNTDPFVFGDRFIYAICQQTESMRKLEPGTIILFGSRVKFRYVIDTVFVVKNAEPNYSLESIKKMNLGKYPEIVTKLIMKDNQTFGTTLYTGATFDDQIEGMYSFAPAKVFDGEKTGFPRFYMPDDFYGSKFEKYFSKSKMENGKIKEGKNQGLKGVNNKLNIEEVKEFWKYLKDVILKKDYVLGVNFKMPEVNNDWSI